MRERSIEEVTDLMRQALAIRQVPAHAIDLIIEDYLGAQLQGRLTHGLGKFLLIDEARKEKKGEPKTVVDHGVAALIDGNREIGQVVAALGIQEASKRAEEHGLGLCGLINFSRYGRLGAISGRIARCGYIGIVLNNAGPPAVSPFGGIDPILGTNPISFAFPTENGPAVFDFATSERVWGEIRQAILEKRPLPDGAFIDENGHVTTEPQAVSAVKAFGGPRGYALCLAIEILAGALVPAKVGLSVDSQFDLGALLIAVKPNLLSGDGTYQKNLATLLSDIRKSRPTHGASAVQIPGDRALAAEAKHREKGTVPVDETTYQHLSTMARDPNAGGLATTRLTD
jgi:L-2-hydroxycarboxylate dehydrogenase (NAD+)